MALLEKLKFVTKNGTEFDTEMGTEFDTEMVPQMAQDPIPGEAPPARRARPGGRPATMPRRQVAPSTAKLTKEVADNFATIIEMGATMWEFAGDECCTPTLKDQAKPIGQAMAAILARNPKMLAAAANSDLLVRVVEFTLFGKAIAPVTKAVWANHVSGAVNDDDSERGHSDRVHLADFPVFSGIPRSVPA